MGKILSILIASFILITASVGQSYADSSINTIIVKYPKLELGVYFQNITDNIVVSNLANTEFTGASTTKVLTAITVIKEIESGKFKYSTPIYKNGPSIASELNLMINQSNNVAWGNLNSLATWTNIVNQANTLGMKGYNCNGNLITPAADARMLSDLYMGNILTKADTHYLLSLMQNTNEENLIPPSLPKGSIYYHKYGWLNDGSSNVLNDTAIILYHNKVYILSIYTNSPNTPNYSLQLNAIHDITSYLFANQ